MCGKAWTSKNLNLSTKRQDLFFHHLSLLYPSKLTEHSTPFPTSKMHLIFSILLFSASQALAYTFAFRDNSDCRGMIIERVVGGSNLGCRKPGQESPSPQGALSVEIASTGAVDNPLMIVFFESDDCRPDTEVGHVDYLEGESGCYTPPKEKPNFRSYEVWDVYAWVSYNTP